MKELIVETVEQECGTIYESYSVLSNEYSLKDGFFTFKGESGPIVINASLVRSFYFNEIEECNCGECNCEEEFAHGAGAFRDFLEDLSAQVEEEMCSNPNMKLGQLTHIETKQDAPDFLYKDGYWWRRTDPKEMAEKIKE